VDVILVFCKPYNIVHCLILIRKEDSYNGVLIIILWRIGAKNIGESLDEGRPVL